MSEVPFKSFKRRVYVGYSNPNHYTSSCHLLYALHICSWLMWLFEKVKSHSLIRVTQRRNLLKQSIIFPLCISSNLVDKSVNFESRGVRKKSIQPPLDF